MADPISFVILVAAAELTNPTTLEMARTARDALGGVVTVREAPANVTDDAALDAETGAHAAGVVELSWIDPTHRRATLRVHLASSGRWVERTIGFMPSDPAAERGRTLGFAIVAIMPEAVPAIAAPATAAPATAPPPSMPLTTPATTPPVAPPAPMRAPVHPSPLVVSPSDGPSTFTELPRLAVNHPPSLAIDVLAGGALGGAAAGFGAAVALQWFVGGTVALRLGGALRAGQVDAAQAHTAATAAYAGIAFHPWRAEPSRPFGAAIRADYLAMRESAAHFDADDTTAVDQARWLSGFDVLVDGSWLFASYVELVAGVGLEDVLATTDVRVRDRVVATFPAVRGVGEAGLRLRF